MKSPDSGAHSVRPLGHLAQLALSFAVPTLSFVTILLAWQLTVIFSGVPPYILPGPCAVGKALVMDWSILGPALWVTTKITLTALTFATVGGSVFALLLAQSRWMELAFQPLAVILQVMPIVAIAPLLLIYVPSGDGALLICAFLVAFFPIASNMLLGIKSVDHKLLTLFDLYGASRWQTLLQLQVPAALPYLMGGLRISGGLALIAAIVAEFAAGSAGVGAGLAFRLLEAQYRLNMPRLFAALFLLALLGLAIFALTSLVSWLVLHRWHDSVVQRSA
jgi:NitT/TauT family transport system permease protein